MSYNYYENVLQDVKDYIENNIDMSQFTSRDELEETLYDELFVADSVTGNGSGSYTFSTYKAEQNLVGNFDLLGEALDEFGCDGRFLLEKGAEACDVTIRCYLLAGAIYDALDDLWIDDRDELTDEPLPADLEPAEIF